MCALVSIIIPTYNRSADLKRAIESVILQTYNNWELIVVDNNSTDNTLEMLSNFQNNKITVISVKNEGVIGYSRNVGINAAKGEYVAFLDSDDWWKIEKIHESLLILESGEADVIYHDCIFIDKDSKTKSKCRDLKNDVLDDLVVNGNTIITSSVVVLKNIIIDVGSFCEHKRTTGWEDYHLWLKLANKGYRFYKLKKNLGLCWKGGDNFDSKERVLINLVEIEKHLRTVFVSIADKNFIWWINYTRGKASIGTNNAREVRKEFWCVIFGKSPAQYKLKSFYLLVKSFLPMMFLKCFITD